MQPGAGTAADAPHWEALVCELLCLATLTCLVTSPAGVHVSLRWRNVSLACTHHLGMTVGGLAYLLLKVPFWWCMHAWPPSSTPVCVAVLPLYVPTLFCE